MTAAFPASASSKSTLLRLDQIPHQRVIGQDEAVQAVADGVIRARSGFRCTWWQTVFTENWTRKRPNSGGTGQGPLPNIG